MPQPEHITFFSGPEHQLKGAFYSPANLDGPHPTVVLCNGYMGLKEIYMPQVAAALSTIGVASFAFDYRGFGESEGPRYRLLPMEQLEDIYNAISYVHSRPDVDKAKIGLWGTSMGGTHALTATALDPRVKCAAANMPAARLRDHIYRRTAAELASFSKELDLDRQHRIQTGRSRRESPIKVLPYDEDSRRAYEASLKKYPERKEMLFPLETADRLAEYMPEKFIDLISPRPMLMLSAELDELTPPAWQRQLFDRAGAPKRLEVIKGATHYSAYTGDFFEEIVRISVEFFKEAMQQ